MRLLSASYALMLSAIVADVPCDGEEFASTSCIDAICPLSTIGTVFVWPATTVVLMVFCERTLPVPFCPSYVAIATVCEPGVTAALTVHVSGVVELAGVQFGDDGARFVACALPESTAIVSDCVDGDIYAGRRVLDVAVFAGILMVKRRSPFRELASGGASL